MENSTINYVSSRENSTINVYGNAPKQIKVSERAIVRDNERNKIYIPKGRFEIVEYQIE